MSDMEQSDVIADAANVEPVAESVAPAQPAEAEPAVDEQNDTSEPVAAPAEPTAEELQAEIDALSAQIAADAAKDVPVPDPVPVVAKQPSSASPTQQPEAATEAIFSVEDAARVVVTLVRAHRNIGDADLEAAISVLDEAYPPVVDPTA